MTLFGECVSNSKDCVATELFCVTDGLGILPTSRKIHSNRQCGCIFLLVEAPALSPGEHKVFWYAVPSDCGCAILRITYIKQDQLCISLLLQGGSSVSLRFLE